MKKLLLLTVFLLSTLLAIGQNTDSVIVFKSEKELLKIGKHVYLFEDKEGKLTIEDIQKPEYQKLFRKSEKEIPNFSITSSKIWVKFTLSNQTEKEIYLEIAQAMAWYIDFYKPDSTGKPILATQTGMMHPMENRELDNNFFLFELYKNPQEQTYYFSIQSEAILIIPMTLGTSKHLFEKSYPYILFFGGFSGLMLIMFFYNLFVYFSVRDKSYLYYCAYLVSNLFMTNFASGNYGHHWNILSYISNYFLVSIFMVGVFMSLFLISLLQVPKKTIFYKVIVIYTLILLIGLIVNLITGHYIEVSRILEINIAFTFIYILVYASYHYIKGKKNFGFVVFGFSFYLVGVIINILQNVGILSVSFFATNAMVIGISFEILMFSLALGNRINQMRKEKEISQNALLAQTQENEKLVREQNIILEQKVAIRTEELQQTNEELNTTLDTISKQRDDIVSSINYALRIQKAIIPKETELQKYLDCFVFFRPRDIVSGDFYWFAEKENCKILAVADCTGHGVSGAFMTMIGNNILNQIVHDYEIYEPNEILSKMQLLLKKVLAQSGEDVKDGMDIAIVKIENDMLTYSGAMNPIYYVQNQEFTEIKADKIPISGVSDNIVTYQKNEISVTTPTIFYLTTDGYQDQFGGDMHRKFMVKNLKKLLFEISHNSLEEQKNILINTFDQWKASYKQTDDVLIVGIKI